ncbi:hypothetical protein ACJX0J_024227, partial [Zea mays]
KRDSVSGSDIGPFGPTRRQVVNYEGVLLSDLISINHNNIILNHKNMKLLLQVHNTFRKQTILDINMFSLQISWEQAQPIQEESGWALKIGHGGKKYGLNSLIVLGAWVLDPIIFLRLENKFIQLGAQSLNNGTSSPLGNRVVIARLMGQPT